ncbi:PDZ domain-containing protein [Aureibaculum algae]|uniref:PDZ domain-containing protein n=1 Tax=Aureibaculum algae TaxID=2584122 RepID=A0A5B7TNI1_9FLAO|nr:aspartyl protease family protein [Aureibaculum algae]QCX37918.1 PDZ domain-containing protein [Aureibaculum algae]
MKKKILKGIGVLLLIMVLIIGFIIYNMSSQYKKLRQGELVSNIVTDTIPFTYSSTGHLLINVKINGSKKLYPFILDSGASSFIFSNHIDELNLEMNGRGFGIDANGSIFLTKIRSVDTLQIGNSIFENTNAKEVVFNFNCSEDIYGIIGTGIMRHLIWQVDFKTQKIIVSKKLTDLSFQKDRIEIPLTENKSSHHLRTLIKLNNQKKPIKVILDLGNSGSLKLNESYALEEGLNLEYKKIDGTSSKGLGGNNDKSKEKFYLSDSLEFEDSSYRIHKFPISTTPKAPNLLGLEFFNKYKTTFSWKDKKLILEPYKNTQNFIWNTYGFSIDYNKKLNKVVIKSVTEKTPASKANLIVNSEVVSINNIPFTDKSSFCNLKNLMKSNDTIKLKIKNDDLIKQHTLIKEPLF